MGQFRVYRAWASFEFIAQDGSINEVDLLVLTPKGLFLVEIKSHPGEISGDAGSSVWTHEGRRKAFDNPRLLTDRKAKKLASLLKCQRSALKAKERIPLINTLVFLSAEHVVNRLQGPARLQVCTRKNVLDELRHTDAHWTHKKLDRPTSNAVSRALEEAGIKESLRSRRVGLYELNELLDEADHFQDWKATHSETGIHRRIRIYLTYGKAEDEAKTLQQAANVEHNKRLRVEGETLHKLRHQSIIAYHETLELIGHTGLILDYAVEGTLARRLRKEGAIQLELLERFGDDLLSAICHLEEKGISHRDIKPENIGLMKQGRQLHLVLFDYQHRRCADAITAQRAGLHDRRRHADPA